MVAPKEVLIYIFVHTTKSFYQVLVIADIRIIINFEKCLKQSASGINMQFSALMPSKYVIFEFMISIISSRFDLSYKTLDLQHSYF